MGKTKFKLVDCTNIKNGYTDSLFKAYSVDIKVTIKGKETKIYCIPRKIAVEVFGEDASDFLYRVSQVLNVGYTQYDKVTQESYITISGYNIMKQYRASVLYDKWHDDICRKVVQNDSSAGKQHGAECISTEGKEIPEIH